MNIHSGSFLFNASSFFGLRGAACLTMLLAGTNIAWAQGLPPGVGGPPPGFNGPPPQAATVEPPRPGGLKIGPRGFTVGDEGGLEKELERNGAVPPAPPLSPDAPPPNSLLKNLVRNAYRCFSRNCDG